MYLEKNFSPIVDRSRKKERKEERKKEDRRADGSDKLTTKNVAGWQGS
jgi:hypothetical protein